jgi:hypothetical protein
MKKKLNKNGFSMPLGNGWAGFKIKNPNYIIVRV